MAASTHFLSLAPRTLSLHHSNSSAAASAPSLFTPSSFKILPKLVLGISSLTSRTHLTSSFVRNVALSSDLEESDGAEAREQSFSPDLKVFVGNLPFDVDSSELAELFKDAGTVEQVEVSSEFYFSSRTKISCTFHFVIFGSGLFCCLLVNWMYNILCFIFRNQKFWSCIVT